MAYIGAFFASLFADPMAAMLSAGLLNQVLTLFSGTMVPGQNLSVYYKWLYYASPLKYLQEGLISTQFHGDHTLVCNPTGIVVEDIKSKLYHQVCTSDGSADYKKITGQVTTAEEFVLGEFLTAYKYDNRWLDLLVLFAWVAGIRFLTIMTFTFVSHEKR